MHESENYSIQTDSSDNVNNTENSPDSNTCSKSCLETDRSTCTSRGTDEHES